LFGSSRRVFRGVFFNTSQSSGRHCRVRAVVISQAMGRRDVSKERWLLCRLGAVGVLRRTLLKQALSGCGIYNSVQGLRALQRSAAALHN
jgi:hypothetical protein